MFRKIKIRMLALVFILNLFGSVCLAENASTNESGNNKSKVTIPWKEFKDILNLDKEEILLSGEDFQKLLAQTGVKTTPPYTFKEGNVILTREEFSKLIGQMKPVHDPELKPPADYLLTKADYKAKMKKENTSFKATFTLWVLKKDAYLKIPLLSQSIALQDVRVDNAPALIITENGFHKLAIKTPGKHLVTASFSVKSSMKKGPHRLNFPVPMTPITLLNLEIPLPNIEVEIPQAQQVRTRRIDNSTVISAIFATTSYININWTKKVPEAKKIPPKLYSEILNLISVEDDALKINTEIKYTILHSEVDDLRVVIPKDVNILNVTGEAVGEWREKNRKDDKLLLIPLNYGKKGLLRIYLQLEKPLSESATVVSFSGVRTVDSVRETGFIGIELKTSAEVKITENPGLEGMAIQKLPRELFNKSISPLLYGFKYLKHPYSLTMDIKRHKKIAVPMSSIDSASVVTLFTEDGKVVHRIVYEVRNSAKQFMQLGLPEDADIWTVFVGNQPVEASINSAGKLLIPLIRSKQENNRLKTFNVEIIYCIVNKKFSTGGIKKSMLPNTDIFISQMIWSVYLPNDYRYLYFKSSLEKEEQVRGILQNVLLGKKRVWKMPQIVQSYTQRGIADLSESGEIQDYDAFYNKMPQDQKSRFRNVQVEREALSKQVMQEQSFSKRMEDIRQTPHAAVAVHAPVVLPMYVKIPTGGQLYRFAKTIIKTTDPLSLNMYYVQVWMIKLIKIVILLLLVYILYRNRKKFKSILDSIKKSFEKKKPEIEKLMQSKFTIILLIGLFIFFLFVFRIMALICFLLLWIAGGYQVIIAREKKGKRKEISHEKEGKVSVTKPKQRFLIPILIGVGWALALICFFIIGVTARVFIFYKLFITGGVLFVIYIIILVIYALLTRGSKQPVTENKTPEQ